MAERRAVRSDFEWVVLLAVLMVVSKVGQSDVLMVVCWVDLMVDLLEIHHGIHTTTILQY